MPEPPACRSRCFGGRLSNSSHWKRRSRRAATGYPPKGNDFTKRIEVSGRAVVRDLDFLRDEARAPLAYDDARHRLHLTDETYTLPPVRISRKEAFSYGLGRVCWRIFQEPEKTYHSARHTSRWAL